MAKYMSDCVKVLNVFGRAVGIIAKAESKISVCTQIEDLQLVRDGPRGLAYPGAKAVG